ncbi:DUF3426 domain-containing protein [Endozoicomonas sp.]|uniref:DUF3426 domain-containing protein n=1 Tax=Endozoicomonas sp. TaxID=1892382 RepID=UPI0028886170|nr:DUF3426 domain-containing protein [Endozoicomonas sp.]
MTPTSVTCPHCKTTFRITNAQLKAANGSVRCGSCLQVFNAQGQVERHKEKEAPTAVKETAATHHEEALAPVKPKHQPQKERATRGKPVNKPAPKPETARVKNLNPSVKAKVASTTKAIEYDGYHQQNIETLIQELDERETVETINEQIRRKKQTSWGIAACALMMLLVLQYAWFNRNTLSLNTTLRPAYTVVCNLFSCSLPPLVDIKAIRSVDLVVRSHPDQNNALQIDVVIINEADHPQPFPDLDLTFTDINGRLVANRTFTPSEYLGGELAGSEEMPKAQPIRLGLEIIDPGKRAVNYQLTFSKNRALRFN